MNPKYLKKFLMSKIKKTASKSQDYCINPNNDFTRGEKAYNLLHLNALYDLNHKIYLDSVIQKKTDKNEHLALQKMAELSEIPKALVTADRGYESFNNIDFSLKLTRKQTNEVKELLVVYISSDKRLGKQYGFTILCYLKP